MSILLEIFRHTAALGQKEVLSLLGKSRLVVSIVSDEIYYPPMTC